MLDEDGGSESTVSASLPLTGSPAHSCGTGTLAVPASCEPSLASPPHPTRCTDQILTRFESLHVSSPRTLTLAVVLLVFVAALYERLRLHASAYDARLRARLVLGAGAGAVSSSASDRPPSPAHAGSRSDGRAWGRLTVPREEQFVRSLLYTLNVAVSFFLMLGPCSLLSRLVRPTDGRAAVVMTYNGFLIGAVLLYVPPSMLTFLCASSLCEPRGAFLGHFTFHRELTFDTDGDKGMACH